MKVLLIKDFRTYKKGRVIEVDRNLQKFLFENGYLTETKVAKLKQIEYKSLKPRKHGNNR